MKLIAGIDPGVTTAIAVVDISSDFYYVASKRDASLATIESMLMEKGEPIIIATDKKNSPSSVKKIAAAFNAVLFLPKNDLQIGEKQEITKKFSYNNLHERDSLAAALFAKRYYQRSFDKVRNSLIRKNMDYILPDTIELLVKGEAGNIEHAIKKLTKKDEKKEIKIVSKVMETRKVVELRGKINHLEKSNESFNKKIEFLEKEKRELISQISKNKSREIKPISYETQRLRNENYDLRKMLKNYEIVYTLDEEDITDKIVLIEHFSERIIERIKQQRPKAIISNDDNIEVDAPIISKSDIKIEKIINFLAVDRKEIKNKINAHKFDFLGYLDKYRARKYAQKI